MVRRLILAVLFSFSFSLSAALRIGDPRPGSDAAIEPAPFFRANAAIATNGDGFLVAWSDERAGTREVRAISLDREGNPIGVDFRVADARDSSVSVASNGTDYMVAHDCVGFFAQDTCVTRVLASGEVIPGARLGKATYGAIAWNGAQYLVVTLAPFAGGNYRRALEGHLLAPDGIAEGGRFRIGTAVDPAWVASNGHDILVVHSNRSTLNGAIVTGTAVKDLSAISRVIPSFGIGAFSWAAATDGNDFLVVWEQNVGVEGTRYRIEMQTAAISRDGNVAAPRTILKSSESDRLPELTWTGANYVLAYTGGGHPHVDGVIQTTSLSRTGELLDEPRTIGEGHGTERKAAAAFNGSVAVVGWHRVLTRPVAAEIEMHRLNAIGEPIDIRPTILSRNLPAQLSVAGKQIGKHTVIAWEEIVGNEQQHVVRVGRLDGSGRHLDGRGIAVHESEQDQVNPAIGGALLAWIEQPPVSGKAEIRTTRLGIDGLPIDGTTITIARAARDSRIAIEQIGANHLVVWTGEFGYVAAARISDAGFVLDPSPVRLSSEEKPASEINPAIATNGETYFVSWNRLESCVFECNPPRSTHAVLVSSTGVLLGPSHEVFYIDSYAPAVVWNGSEYVLFWTSALDPLGRREARLRARRYDRSGNALGDSRELSRDVVGDLTVVRRGGDYFFIASFDGYESQNVVAGQVNGDFLTVDLRVINSFARPSSTMTNFHRDTRKATLINRGALDPLAIYESLESGSVPRATAREISTQPFRRGRAVRAR